LCSVVPHGTQKCTILNPAMNCRAIIDRPYQDETNPVGMYENILAIYRQVSVWKIAESQGDNWKITVTILLQYIWLRTLASKIEWNIRGISTYDKKSLCDFTSIHSLGEGGPSWRTLWWNKKHTMNCRGSFDKLPLTRFTRSRHSRVCAKENLRIVEGGVNFACYASRSKIPLACGSLIQFLKNEVGWKSRSRATNSVIG
jgi:hypothetical protein